MKNFKAVVVVAAMIMLVSSCSKTDNSYVGILTSHKWNVTSAVEGYSDSAVTHNLLSNNPACQVTGYTEFDNYAPNSQLRLAFNYTTSTCPGYNMPNIGKSAWDIDRDNLNLYLNGSSTDGTGGQWFKITTLNGSTIVLTYVYQRVIGNTGSPNFTPIYDTATDTITWTAQ